MRFSRDYALGDVAVGDRLSCSCTHVGRSRQGGRASSRSREGVRPPRSLPDGGYGNQWTNICYFLLRGRRHTLRQDTSMTCKFPVSLPSLPYLPTPFLHLTSALTQEHPTRWAERRVGWSIGGRRVFPLFHFSGTSSCTDRSLIHIYRCRGGGKGRSRWSPNH